MITHIRVQNFKSWEDSGEVKLAPLTGFFGTNSSGKSSLLQMLLLLKQTTEEPNVEGVIFFGNENSLVNLGNFSEVIHGHKQEKLLELEFGCKLRKPNLINVSLDKVYGFLTVPFFPMQVANEAKLNMKILKFYVCEGSPVTTGSFTSEKYFA